ncbi:MAG: SIS domain-containing protein [Promethearchaeota archaeon]
MEKEKKDLENYKELGLNENTPNETKKENDDVVEKASSVNINYKAANLELGKYTLSEIWQIPEVIHRAVLTKEAKKKIRAIAEKIVNNKTIVSIYCLGSGTSYHAGMTATYWFSILAKYPTHSELAPEFPYLLEPIIAPKHLVICISQSGESELTVYAAKKAKEAGATVIAITNNLESRLAKIGGEYTIYTNAGKEKSVLATKTYLAELVCLTALALDMALLRGHIDQNTYDSLWAELRSMPKILEMLLPTYRSLIRKIAPYFKFARNAFVIGAGPDYANCLEAALKLKEGARIFAQAYSTAEFPHGPITLAESHSAFVLCIVPRKEAKMRHNDVIKLINRLLGLGVTVLAIKNPDEVLPEPVIAIDTPNCSEEFHPIFSIVPIQLLVVEIATIQGINCDTPKYLSKISGL